MPLVICRHKDLESYDPRIWKPMYRRLRGIAKIKGHCFSHSLVGMGCAWFDGKRYRTDRSGVVFEFRTFEEHDAFMKRAWRVPDIRLRSCNKETWWDEQYKVW